MTTGRLKGLLKKALEGSGWDVRRTSAVSNMYASLIHFSGKLGVTTLLDAGANTGQFGRWMIDAGWHGDIVSFEPLSTAHAALSKLASDYPNWNVAPRMALGRRLGAAEINIAGNSQSSSLLPMVDAVQQAGSDLNYVGTESVDVVPLADWICDRPASERYLLKLDVQGFEIEALEGLGSSLGRCPVVHTEMSLQEHYVGEALFTELSTWLMSRGYRCVGIRPGYFDPASREILQVDGTFLR